MIFTAWRRLWMQPGLRIRVVWSDPFFYEGSNPESRSKHPDPQSFFNNSFLTIIIGQNSILIQILPKSKGRSSFPGRIRIFRVGSDPVFFRRLDPDPQSWMQQQRLTLLWLNIRVPGVRPARSKNVAITRKNCP